MKKIVSLILAALLLFAFTAVAEQEAQEGPQTYEWSKYEQIAELMGAEGNWATYGQFSLKLWIPAGYEQAPDDQISEDYKSQGYIDLFGSDDHPLAIGVQFTNLGEGLENAEDLYNNIDASKYDAPTLTKVNNYNALLLTENNGENMTVCIGAGDGDFLMIHYFHMNADEWSTGRAVVSMASIQRTEE